jgi:hypothetical protein
MAFRGQKLGIFQKNYMVLPLKQPIFLYIIGAENGIL